MKGSPVRAVGRLRRTAPRLYVVVGAFLLVGALAWAGCGDDDDSGDRPSQGSSAYEAPGTGTAESDGAAESGGEGERADQGQQSGAKGKAAQKASAADGTAIKLAASPVGDALFDGENQAIYLFDAEQSATPECYDACAAAWPPVLTHGEPVAQGPVKQTLLGTTERSDGSTQVTYNGRPLYYYAHEGPGELRCHNIDEFGGLWLALDETGEALPA